MSAVWIYYFHDGVPGAIEGLGAALTVLRAQKKDADEIEIAPIDSELISVLGLWVRAPEYDSLVEFKEKLEARFKTRKIKAKGVPWTPYKIKPEKE